MTDTLKIERALLERIISRADDPARELTAGVGAPGHSHRAPGVWDADGSYCEVCADWNQLRAILAQPQQPEHAGGVEVVAWLFKKPDGTLCMDAVRHRPSQDAEPVITLAAHTADRATLAAEVERLRGENEALRLNVVTQVDAHAETRKELAALRAQLDQANALLREWRRMFDCGIASGTLGILRGQTDDHLSKQ